MFKLEMEDGRWVDVVDCNWSTNPSIFTIHSWGNTWLTSSLPDDVILKDLENEIEVTIGEIRHLWMNVVVGGSKDGTLRRPLFWKGADVNLNAKPFSLR